MDTITAKLPYEETLNMSNFDHTIDPGLEESLKAGRYAQHAAWNFCGWVWFNDGFFCEEVWRYGGLIAVRSAETLEELMEVVNDEFGWE